MYNLIYGPRGVPFATARIAWATVTSVVGYYYFFMMSGQYDLLSERSYDFFIFCINYYYYIPINNIKNVRLGYNIIHIYRYL